MSLRDDLMEGIETFDTCQNSKHKVSVSQITNPLLSLELIGPWVQVELYTLNLIVVSGDYPLESVSPLLLYSHSCFRG